MIKLKNRVISNFPNVTCPAITRANVKRQNLLLISILCVCVRACECKCLGIFAHTLENAYICAKLECGESVGGGLQRERF